MPVPDPLPDLLSNFRAYLISEGIVREPRTAAPEPPLWLEPQDGAPGPGDRSGTEDDENAVLSVFRSGGVGLNFVEQRYHRKDTVDVVIRTLSPKLAAQIEEQLRYALIGSGGGDLKMSWEMADLTVIQSQLWRPLQPLDFSGDPAIYTAVCAFYFELYTSG